MADSVSPCNPANGAASAPQPARLVDDAFAQAFAAIDRVLRSELNLERPARLDEELAADLQLDSVSLLTLVVELENQFQVALREEDAEGVRTVRDLAALVAARVLEAGATAAPFSTGERR